MRRIRRPPAEGVGPNTPLRLLLAAAMAFPDGSMTASGLRREAARGRLIIERIAGKDYTTLANIERMRELCRVEVKAPDCGSGQLGATRVEKSHTAPFGLSSMGPSISPQDALKVKVSAQSKF